MPNYRTTIVFSTNDPQEQDELIQIADGCLNGIRVPATIERQGNKFTIRITRFDIAETPEEAQHEWLKDMYHYFLEEIMPTEDADPYNYLDDRYWIVKDIDIRIYLTDVLTEVI